MLNNTNTKQNETNGISLIKTTISLLNKYGAIKIIFSCFLMVFISYTTYLAFNPSIIFDRYAEYEEKKHTESFFSRMESTPVVQSMLTEVLNETHAMRAFIIEMHNGKYNASGLSFNYGSMTYEALRENSLSISEDYSDFTLERYPFFSKVYKSGYWYGSIENLTNVDKRLALKIESNDAKYLFVNVIYGTKAEIGFIGVTFNEEDKINTKQVSTILQKYSSKIAPYLDGNGLKK